MREESRAGDHERTDARRTARRRAPDVEGHVAQEEPVAVVPWSTHIGDFRTEADPRGEVDSAGSAKHRVLDRRLVCETGMPSEDLD